jgi:hypothetical protein
VVAALAVGGGVLLFNGRERSPLQPDSRGATAAEGPPPIALTEVVEESPTATPVDVVEEPAGARETTSTAPEPTPAVAPREAVAATPRRTPDDVPADTLAEAATKTTPESAATSAPTHGCVGYQAMSGARVWVDGSLSESRARKVDPPPVPLPAGLHEIGMSATLDGPRPQTTVVVEGGRRYLVSCDDLLGSAPTCHMRGPLGGDCP